tara:strand:- start:492 stop:875 length:384 start_codon:yes stop_codon:yes gene_type:complete
MSFISKIINYDTEKLHVFNLKNNLYNIFITKDKPLIVSDEFTIHWDYLYDPDILYVKKNTLINWDTDKFDIYLLSSEILYNHCIVDEQINLTKKINNIFTYFIEPGYYYFSSKKNCKNGKKITIIVE